MDRNVDSCGVDWVEALHLIRLIASIFEFVQLDRLNSCLRIPTKDLEESLRTLSKRETGNHPERIPLIGSRVGKTILKNPLPPPKKNNEKETLTVENPAGSLIAGGGGVAGKRLAIERISERKVILTRIK